ncbi:MAG: recombinase family protein [Actinomycetota bacterium]|jgi:DNA invertase Pin-like site-specific DNA recombinase|nr:recombinase family protein [Actinomycetota bacterium]MDA8185201.1 recombinase family protein [Actinomycetota bacterium]MDA8300669.1 recombinase family protein [Actinomycetota bacterium]
MSAEARGKISASHLSRQAYLYVRQSTLRQVLENTESTKRQYALRERAVALGWQPEQVVVIDSDLGQSGADADRVGFQRLVAAVGVGEVGVVLGLEVSRLARNSSDWHRLLEICALANTLILDEDGLYDPSHFNDRLLLGMKGTMSEAELHVLRARLIGGQLAKAARGELEVPLPVGLVYDAGGKVALDPDRSVQKAIGQFFDTFVRTGSATATVRSFREQGLLFPRRVQSGPHKGELVWGSLLHYRALNVLKNPRYAGAFAYGRSRATKTLQGTGSRHRLPQDQWHTLILDAHPGYITWADYEENLAKLRANAAAYGADRRAGPPREGPALLQGLALCGRCGGRMTVRYYTRRGQSVPQYSCQSEGIRRAEPPCQRIVGGDIDRAVGELLVECVSPLALDVALSVQDELATRAQEADQLRHQQVERARYEVELAQRRYLRVDPDNRLVAATLEAEWNNRLRALEAAQENYDRQRAADTLMDDESRQRVLALATDFPRLWSNPDTPARERKRMARLLIEDVTLLKADDLLVHVRFRGGDTRTLRLARPKSAVDLHKLDPAVVAEVDRLLDDHTDSEIVEALNTAGHQPPVGATFSIFMVWKIRKAHRLESRFDRLRRKGLLTRDEMAEALGVHPATVKARAVRGQLASVVYNDKGERLYAPPEPVAVVPCARCGKPIPERAEQGQLRKYCGVTCRTGAYAARRQAAGWVRTRTRS